MNINSISKVNNINSKVILSTNNDNKASFGDYLKNAIDKVNDLQVQSDYYNELLATGQTDNIHQVMIAAEKADIALQFTMSVRNKILDAYKEIMRMQV